MPSMTLVSRVCFPVPQSGTFSDVLQAISEAEAKVRS